MSDRRRLCAFSTDERYMPLAFLASNIVVLLLLIHHVWVVVLRPLFGLLTLIDGTIYINLIHIAYVAKSIAQLDECGCSGGTLPHIYRYVHIACLWLSESLHLFEFLLSPLHHHGEHPVAEEETHQHRDTGIHLAVVHLVTEEVGVAIIVLDTTEGIDDGNRCEREQQGCQVLGFKTSRMRSRREIFFSAIILCFQNHYYYQSFLPLPLPTLAPLGLGLGASGLIQMQSLPLTTR